MGRRSGNDGDLIELILKLGGLIFLLSFINPQVRSLLLALGSLLILAVVALVVGLICFAIFRIATKKRTSPTPAYLQEFVSNAPAKPNPIPAILPTQIKEPTLVEKFRKIDWFQFEKLVALIYEKQGYAVTRLGGANPDGGVDLIVEKDGTRSAVQCKQWKTWNVGVKPVREFLGAMTATKIRNGIFITLNGYYGDAKKLAEENNIEIINETGLTAMLEGLNLERDPDVLELLNDFRKFCPKCERLMVERVAGKGLSSGQRFWGCSGYPKCRFTMPMP